MVPSSRSKGSPSALQWLNKQPASALPLTEVEVQAQ